MVVGGSRYRERGSMQKNQRASQWAQTKRVDCLALGKGDLEGKNLQPRGKDRYEGGERPRR